VSGQRTSRPFDLARTLPLLDFWEEVVVTVDGMDPRVTSEVVVGLRALPRQRVRKLKGAMSSLARLVLHTSGFFKLSSAELADAQNEVFEILEESNDAPRADV